MFKVSTQSLFGAGLLLTLAFGFDDRSPGPEQSQVQANVQLACDDGGLSRVPGSSRDDTQLCREAEFR